MDEENPSEEERGGSRNDAPEGRGNDAPEDASEGGGDEADDDEPDSEERPVPKPKHRNINSYYGHKIGFLQTLSLTLNAGLMVYAHVGLSAVILSSQDPSITAIGNLNNKDDDSTKDAATMPAPNNGTDLNCDANDVEVWIEHGGEAARANHSNFCSRTYDNNGNPGCFLDVGCIERCFQEEHGYSAECSTCFGVIPTCSINTGCIGVCATNSLGPECQRCNVPCIEELKICTGLPEVNSNETIPPNDENSTSLPPNSAAGNVCNDFDLGAIDKWYNVYDLTFAKSIRDAWNGDAKLLAVIIVMFSGIWPYLKNLILVIIWYLPTSSERQTATLLWLSRLSKYTLVDVFAVIGVLVGVQLQLDVGGTEAVTRAEPRFGIIAFFVATVWEFLQIELIKAMHERKVLGGRNAENVAGEDRLLFSKLWIPVLVLAASLGLYVSGALAEIVYFSSSDGSGLCERSYNLVTLGNALVNEQSMTSNSAPAQTWILYLSYVVLNLAFPILTHLLQICFILGWSRSKRMKRLIEWTSAVWCFACVEVLLIGIFAVEYKFPNLIMKIAGDSNAGFLDINSQLGSGFYILIAYSVVAGFLQYSLRVRNDGSARLFVQGSEGAEKENDN